MAGGDQRRPISSVALVFPLARESIYVPEILGTTVPCLVSELRGPWHDIVTEDPKFNLCMVAKCVEEVARVRHAPAVLERLHQLVQSSMSLCPCQASIAVINNQGLICGHV